MPLFALWLIRSYFILGYVNKSLSNEMHSALLLSVPKRLVVTSTFQVALHRED